MSDTSAFGFGKFVPGFDFLQNLAKSANPPSSAGSAIPGMSSWVAPTLSVEELDKRIQELKAVQFWLEQNGTALKATIQALEVQKMTLTTLQGMNVNMAELAKAFTARPPEPVPPQASAPAPEPEAQTEPAPQQPPKATEKTRRSAKTKAAQPDSGAQVDPMQWWGSLTQQFQNIASAAMQDVAAQAMKAQESTAAAPPETRTTAPAARKPAATKAAAKKPAPRKPRPSRS
jgi:hypothetical protein